MKAMKNNLQLYSSSETHSFTSPSCDAHSNDDLAWNFRVEWKTAPRWQLHWEFNNAKNFRCAIFPATSSASLSSAEQYLILVPSFQSFGTIFCQSPKNSTSWAWTRHLAWATQLRPTGNSLMTTELDRGHEQQQKINLKSIFILFFALSYSLTVRCSVCVF